MRQTIRNYLGSLLPQFFEVSISAKGEDLAQLMYTMMMSGYMFRNAQYRLELRDSMLPSGKTHRATIALLVIQSGYFCVLIMVAFLSSSTVA